MKPTLNSVFPKLELGKYQNMVVDSIKLNKKSRSMELALEENIDDNAIEKLEDKIKEYLGLSAIYIKSKQEIEDEKLWANSKNYNSEFQRQIKASLENHHSSDDAPSVANNEFMGKARIKNVIYGRSIRGMLSPISSINEDSGNVCFEGEIFNVETKDIHSKKTEKDFLLIMLYITDYKVSVSCQLFI